MTRAPYIYMACAAALAAACGNDAAPAAGEAAAAVGAAPPPTPTPEARALDAAPAPPDAAPDAAVLTPAQRKAYGEQLAALRPGRTSAGPWRDPTPLRAVADARAFCGAYVARGKPGARGCEATGDVHGELPAPWRQVEAVRYGELGAVHGPDALRDGALVITTRRGAFVREHVARDPAQWVDLSVTGADAVGDRLIVRYAHARGRQQVEEVEAVIVCAAPARGPVACTDEIPTSYRMSWELEPAYDEQGDVIPAPPAPAPVEHHAAVAVEPDGTIVVTPDERSAAWYGDVAGRHAPPGAAPAPTTPAPTTPAPTTPAPTTPAPRSP